MTSRLNADGMRGIGADTAYLNEQSPDRFLRKNGSPFHDRIMGKKMGKTVTSSEPSRPRQNYRKKPQPV